jgi:sarcosine oxidase subunit gamma
MAKSPLDGADVQYGGVRIAEVADLALVSVAIPQNGRVELADALANLFGAKIPDVGCTTSSEDGQMRALGLQQDQFWMMFGSAFGQDAHSLVAKLGDVAYLTDQSDSWVFLRISGAHTIAVLERLCPLDLHPDAFPVGGVARTIMEHMATILVREAEDQFLLISPRSSANDFFHTVTENADHT